MVRKLAYSVSEREHWISAVGGLIGILAVLWVSHYWMAGHGGVLAIASVGASAVLLFAAPHGALSQPWPMLAASLAVVLSIAAMYSLHCLHPPRCHRAVCRAGW